MAFGPPTHVSNRALQAIAARLGLPSAAWIAQASIGTANSIFRLGDAFVLKVPRQHAAIIAGAAREAHAASIARAAGVRTPAVVLFDDSCTLLPVPFTVYDYIDGVPLPSPSAAAATTPSVWRALGSDLARLHTGVARSASTNRITTNRERYDARPWLDECLAAGTLLPDEAAWLRSWLDRLGAFVPMSDPRWFCHGDVNAGNVLVSASGDTYRALLDWGGAMWFDAAYDFAVVTLAAVPWLLEGYCAEAPLPAGATLEARILWYHLTLAIWSTRRRSPHDRADIGAHMARLQQQTAVFVAQAASPQLL